MKSLYANAGKLVDTIVWVCTGCGSAFRSPRNLCDFRRCLVLRRPDNEILCKSATIAQASDVINLRSTLFFSREQSVSQPYPVNILACRLLC
jgi:hypothetical protein